MAPLTETPGFVIFLFSLPISNNIKSSFLINCGYNQWQCRNFLPCHMDILAIILWRGMDGNTFIGEASHNTLYQGGGRNEKISGGAPYLLKLEIFLIFFFCTFPILNFLGNLKKKTKFLIISNLFAYFSI